MAAKKQSPDATIININLTTTKDVVLLQQYLTLVTCKLSNTMPAHTIGMIVARPSYYVPYQSLLVTTPIIEDTQVKDDTIIVGIYNASNQPITVDANTVIASIYPLKQG